MKKYYRFSISMLMMFLGLNLSAQDTTLVQTFTWDSTARSAFFDFPDVPGKNYEKILMIYNMRCHDAAVGNGAVGCREWDYSCNTFLHVPEKQDSSLAFQYDYDVSQHSDDYFAYTNETHYTYYAFDKITTEYKKVNSEHVFDLGEAAGSFDLVAGQAGKMFMLFSRNELEESGLTPGSMDGLALHFEGTSSINSARISLAGIEDSTIIDGFYPNTALTEVFFDDLDVVDGTGHFRFHTPFDWDGESNLLIELSYDDIEGTQPGILGSSDHEKQCVVSNLPSTFALEFGGAWGIELDPDIFAGVEDEFSIAFWSFGRPQSLPNRNTTVFEAYDANNNRTVNIHLPWSNAGIYWDCGNTGGSYDRINKTASEIEFEGKWNHWVFTKNTTTGSMKIFLNGELWHSGEGKTKPIDMKKIRLGSGVPHNIGYYGMLNEVSFWNVELDEDAIRELMGEDFVFHSLKDFALAYYHLNEGAGHTIYDFTENDFNIEFEGGPEWRSLKGRDIHSNMKEALNRPAIKIYRGDYNIEQEIVQVLDTVITPKNSVIKYAVEQSKLVAIDTFFVWEANDSKIFDEYGEELESIYVDIEDFLFFEELSYYRFYDGKFEILSLVTPYGNGLDLGPEGKTFTFDVTDFAPILKGNKRLSIEMGGQNQEELDIKFLFIEGTPTRDVIDINNIWPFARGYYQSILDDKVFEPRMVSIPAEVNQAKIRSSVTGHGQNGEFVAREHRMQINGNEKVFKYNVWKECSFNPIYPQGGTWLYDRAGWCPGMATDLHEFDITSFLSSGDPVELDYNVFGPYMDQANYLVSNQLVYYGEPNFNLDASLEHIVRPNQDAVEFARFNPNCTDPAVIIKNNGKTNITSLKIIYGVEGISEKSYTWSGNLGFLESTEVTLPVDALSFYGSDSTNTFFARIELPNGINDEYVNNNALKSLYIIPDVYEGHERWLLRVRTNNQGSENNYKLYDQAGNIVINRNNLSSNTTYDDEMSLPPGCYSFKITDSGNDGLSYWHNPGAGSGWVSIRRMVNDNISFEKIKFESDFGGEFQYDFIIDESVGTQDNSSFKRVSMYPNPTDSDLTLDIEGLMEGEIRVQIIQSNGQLLRESIFDIHSGNTIKRLSVDDLTPGHYVLRLFNEEGTWVKSFIKL